MIAIRFLPPRGITISAYCFDGSINCKNIGRTVARYWSMTDHPGVNVGRGGDDTLFALVDGVVRFERKGRDKKQASVYPVEAK